jgi:hypothetical protein
MATQVQFRRGTTAQTSTFTGATAEITVDTTKSTIVVHDGSTAGGFALARESALSSNVASITSAFNAANAAFLQANTPSYTANSAASYANSAFLSANTPSYTANSAASYANSGFAVANSAASYANSGFSLANGHSAIANSAAAYANSAFFTANTPSNVANSAASYANAAFATANTISSASSYANSSFLAANSAFTRANNSLNANTGGTVAGDVIITGNLTIQGQQTYANTQTVLIADNIITVNAAINQASAPAFNAGIEVDRGSSANTSLLWNESTDKWTATNDGTNYFNLASDSAESYANSGFAIANSASIYANSAYVRANNSLNANTGGTIAGQIAVDAGTYGNVTITQFASVYGQAYGPNAYSIVQVKSSDFVTGMGMQVYAGLNGLFYSNTGIQFNTSTIVRDKDYPTGGTNAGQFAANGAFIAQASLASTSNTTGSIQVLGGVGVKGNVYADSVYSGGQLAASIGDALALSIALG